jgi:hypothetical protein
MSGPPPPPPPAPWRAPRGSGPDAGRPARRGRVVLLLGLLAALVGLLGVSLPWFRPRASCHLLPLCVASHWDRSFAPLAWRVQDRDGLVAGDYFRTTHEVPGPTLDQAALVRELSHLRGVRRGALVVYLCAAARTDAGGQVHLLPADADLDDPTTWLPLRRVLGLLGQSGARHRLLVLDLEPAKVAPRHTLLLDDVAACVPNDLAAVKDGRRLVLCSCAAGQKPLTSGALNRSVFGHYLEEGLRGWADASGDGVVTARELADFVRARVDHWAAKVGRTRQTPVLLGDGDDFMLVDLPVGQPLPHREVPEPAAYPAFLQEAWKSATGAPGRLHLLTGAERDWRGGSPEEQVRQEVQSALQLPTAAAASAPRPRSLALALGGAGPRGGLVDSLRQVVFRAEARARGLPPDKAGEVRRQLGGEFLKAAKDVPAAEVAAAAVGVAAADPRPDALRFLDELVRQVQPEPEFVETLALRRAAAGGLPGPLVGQALAVVRAGAWAAGRPGAFGWVAPRLRRAAWKEHEALVMLEAPGFAPRARAEELLAGCAAEQAALLAEEEVVLEARAALAEAAALLPGVARFSEQAGRPDGPWLGAADLAGRLAARLGSSRGPALAGALDELRRLSGQLAGRLQELREPFTPDGLRALVRSSRSATASARAWRDLDGVLATSLVAGADRGPTWGAAAEVERRLAEEVLRQDRQAGTRLPDAAPEPPAGEQAPGRRVRAALALLRLAGLPTLTSGGPPNPSREDRPALAELETKVQRAWRDLAAGREPGVGGEAGDQGGRELWAFLADHYRYLGREYAALQGGSPAAAFYGRAALDYRPWLDPGREEFGEVIETGDPPRLLPARPVTALLTVRGVRGKERQPPLQLRLFAPNEEWLAFEPREVDLPGRPPTLRALPDGGWLAPVHVALKDGAGRGESPAPEGLLAQVRLGGRAYHRKVPVPLAPRGPEVVLAVSDKGPSPAVDGVGLRALAGRQAFFLYVRNPIDRVWNKLTVRLTAGAETRESEPFALGARQVQRVAFKAAPAAPAPAAPGAAAGPPATVALPALEGPLRVAVIDQEEKKAVSEREVGVGLAPPSEYVEVTQVRFDPAVNRLSVRVRLRRPQSGPPVTVELLLPPVAEGGATYRDGTLKGSLPPDGKELLLFADGVAGGRDGQALFYLNVDGWARAFTFRATLSERGGVGTPQAVGGPAVRLRVGPFALAGPGFTVPLEVDNAPAGATLQLTVGRLAGGAYRAEVTAVRPSARERKVGFTASGPGGALAFEASLRDWAPALDTGRIRGPREVRARLLDALGREVQLASRTVVFGDQAPGGVRFVDPPAKAWRGAPLALRARGGDAVVGIQEAAFFVGKPVAGKPPEGATLVKAAALDSDRTLWGAKLPLPADGKGPTAVSVRFVNSVGLTSFATTTVELLEANPALTAKGTIKGVVREGERPQAGLDVVLTDDKGAEKGRVKAGADGTFTFADLPAGKYKVSANKSSSGRKGVYPRAAAEFIDLKPGGTETAEVVLFL